MPDASVVHCRRIGRTRSTVESFEHGTRCVPPTLGSLPLKKLTAHNLDDLYGDLAEHVAANTVRQTHAILTAELP